MTAEKKKTPKKKISRLREVKKPLMVGGIIAVLAIAGIVVGIYVFSSLQRKQPEKVITMSLGGIPRSIDPLEVEGGVDLYLLELIAEGLFATDNESNIIYALATYHEWSTDLLNLTCSLRTGVKFHDGTLFDASTVKVNIERITGLLPNMTYSNLWTFPNGTLLLNDTIVLDDYTIRFKLNAPYIPFVSLLASWTSFILSPDSIPEDGPFGPKFIDLETEKIFGTGAFMLDEYIADSNMTFSANPHYWDVKPKFDKLIMTKIETYSEVEAAFLAGEIDFMHDFGGNAAQIVDTFRNNASFIVKENVNPNLRWIVMNNKLINKTMRKAILFAFNYSIIETIGGVRQKSPIPHNILYHNITGIDIPYYNVSLARQILIDELGPVNSRVASLTANYSITADNKWEKLVTDGNPIVTYNYSYPIDYQTDPINFTTPLVENLKQIGIEIVLDAIPRFEWFGKLFDWFGYTRDEIEITYGIWYADYNDPSTMINNLFSNEVITANYGQINDSTLQSMIKQATKIPNSNERAKKYYDIQKYIIEDLFPIGPSYSTVTINIYRSNIRGWYYNPFRWDFNKVYIV